MSIKLVSLNIEMSKHYERVIPFLKHISPDVICLQEVLEEDFESLKERLGYEGFFKAWTYQNSLAEHYKDVYSKRAGIAVFAKNIVGVGHTFYSGKEESLSVPFDVWIKNKEELKSCALVWITTQDREGATYRVITTHFPVTKEGESSPYQLEILQSFFKTLESFGDFVLCGDFNAPRGNETFTRLAYKYKDCIPKEYMTSIDNTLHRNRHQNIMFMVDGLFISNDSYSANDVHLVDGVSDHMAIVVTIIKNI